MKISEISSKDTTELNVLLLELTKEQFNLRIQKGIGQLNSPHRVKMVRRDIARVKTLLKQKVAK